MVDYNAWLPKRLRTELSDLLSLVLLPGLAAVLPWRWCFALFKRMAAWSFLYREPCVQALREARRRGWGGENEEHWLWSRRLVTLVDHADHYLGLFRSDDWMRQHLAVSGAWPTERQAVMLLTFHWGAGFWGLRHAAAHGLAPHALMASLDTQAYAGRTVLRWYARSRNAHVRRILRAPTIDVAQDLKSVVRALRAQEPLLGVMDVPADEAKTSLTVNLLGMKARFPRGLLRLAVDQSVPVVVYATGLDTRTGRRFLRITPLGVPTSVEDLGTEVFGMLEQLIAEDAPAWHFWGIADRVFVAPDVICAP